jgi:hypothetical protein
MGSRARLVGVLGVGIVGSLADGEVAILCGRQAWDRVHRLGNDLAVVSHQRDLVPVDGGRGGGKGYDGRWPVRMTSYT